jgi:hypothetical protein
MSQLSFLDPGTALGGMGGATVGDFWRWAYSDVLSNRNRSLLAEFIVGQALGATRSPRVEWDAVDLRYDAHTVEVKASAACQSWPQSKPSVIRFSIRKSVAWNFRTGAYEGAAARSADLYIFCHYSEMDRARANVLDALAWDFYVVTTATINRLFGDAKSVSLASVRRAAARCKFDALRATVDAVLRSGLAG